MVYTLYLILSMIFQAIVPLFLMSTNISICLSLLIPSDSVDSTILTLQMLSVIPLHWLPVLNPLITIMTIRSFRKAILGKIMSIQSSNQWQICGLCVVYFFQINLSSNLNRENAKKKINKKSIKKIPKKSRKIQKTGKFGEFLLTNFF